MLEAAGRYLVAALLTCGFGAVYELFSHEVYSYRMIYAFAIPLAGGTGACLALASRGRRAPRPAARALYACGIATLTVGCLVEGALEIYGTTNSLTLAYWIAGGLLALAALAKR